MAGGVWVHRSTPPRPRYPPSFSACLQLSVGACSVLHCAGEMKVCLCWCSLNPFWVVKTSVGAAAVVVGLDLQRGVRLLPSGSVSVRLGLYFLVQICFFKHHLCLRRWVSVFSVTVTAFLLCFGSSGCWFC
jgi:hypothetical protein